MDEQTEGVKEEVKKTRPPLVFVLFVLILIGIFISGLKWVFTLSAGDVNATSFLVFDYAVGLTMIFLPCTLPLAFVIVPIVMGKSYQKGIGMALAFGLGVTITLSLYGALIGLLGQVLGIHQVETAKNILYAIAGLFAILFALGELGLIKFKAPTYGGGVPQVIMRQKDLVKAGLLGLFLGNVGVGCPNPLFNAVIIPQIIATGSPFQGWIIMLVQALGRITPLFILAFLAILGINATSFLVRHKDKVTKITAWTTLYVGGFLLTLGLFGHDWWVISGIHTLGEKLTQENAITSLLGSKVKELGHGHGIPAGTGLFGLPITLGMPVLIFVWIFPMLWFLVRREKGLVLVPQEQQAQEKRYLSLLTWFFVLVFTLIITIFGYLLPHMFAEHWSKESMEHETEEMSTSMIEKKNISSFHATLSSSPTTIQAGKAFTLNIALHDGEGNPIKDLQISHERILHVILVSEDLEEFKHVHPEDSVPASQETIISGGFNIPLTLSKTGRYRVLVDASRKGIGEVFDVGWFKVGNKEASVTINKDLSRDRIFDRYRVMLRIDPNNLISGKEIHLNYYIEKDGSSVFDTEPYLGADMHLAIMSIDLSTMIHTHGTKAKLENQGLLPKYKSINVAEASKIDAHYIFRYPGLWKIYGQFQHKRKVITTEFMVEVAPDTIDAQEIAPHIDDHQR